MRKGFAQIILLSAIVVIVAVIIIGFLLYQKSQLSSTQNIVITQRTGYSITKGLLLELNISGNDKIVLLSKPEIVSSYPNYLPGSYKFAAKVLSANGNILGEYGFGDPRIRLCEMGADCKPLDESDFTLVIPYLEGIRNVDIYSGSKLMLSVDTSSLKDD